MRRQRVDYEGAVHHVMNRGVNRQTVFFGDADRIRFGELLAEIHERFGVETLAYCLLGNHYHLLVRTPRAGLSEAMQHLGGVYTRRTNERVGRDGPLFRGRFHSIHVTTDTYLTMAARYIHRNPLELSGVTDPAAYRWSSYRTYLGFRETPSFVHTDLILGLYGHDPRRLMEHTGDLFEGQSSRNWSLDDIQQLIAFEIARRDVVDGDDDAPRILDRTLLLLLLDAGVELAQAIERQLAFPSTAARRMAIGRAQRLADTDHRIAQILTRLVHRLAQQPRAA